MVENKGGIRAERTGSPGQTTLYACVDWCVQSSENKPGNLVKAGPCTGKYQGNGGGSRVTRGVHRVCKGSLSWLSCGEQSSPSVFRVPTKESDRP